MGFWINNIQLKVPNAVVLLLGTHVDCCSDEKDVQDKKSDIEERVNQMLLDRKDSLEQQRMNLEDLKNPSLVSEQICAIERLEEYKLQVTLCMCICIYSSVYTSNFFVTHIFSACIGP